MRDSIPSGQYGWSGMTTENFSRDIKRAAKNINKMYKENKFDAIAFTGSSGAAIAFFMSAEYKIPLLYVRKTGEKSHGMNVECNSPEGIKKYLIVDDFVSTGTTIRSIVRKIKKHCAKYGVTPFEPIGVYTYCSQWNTTVKIDTKLSLKIFDNSSF